MFLHPLGLFALLAVPIVVGLHLFRRRFRPHAVSAIFLWEPQDRAPVAGRKREPLRASPSFWCEVFAALLLAFAFAGPRACGAGEAQHLVVVLDASASMGARGTDGLLADKARELVRGRIEGLSRGSRVTLVRSGPRPTLLAGPAAFTREALEELDTFAPSLARHDLVPSVAFGLQLAGEGSVLLVTDHYDPEAWPEEIEVASIGTPIENLAITHATRRRVVDDSSEPVERVHLTVSNFGFEETAAKVTLRSAGVVLDESEAPIEAGDRRHFAFTLPAGAPVIEARLPEDGLSIDDVAWLAPVPPRTLAIASTLPDDLSRFLGLMGAGQEVSNIDRLLNLIPDSIDAKNPAGAHLVLSQSVPPGGAWCLNFESSGDERRHLIGPFLVDKRHPLLEGLTLEGIVWSTSPVTLTGAPIVSAGNEPLVTEERDGTRLVFHANLDPSRSSLQRSPDWPILLANLAEMRRAELPGPARTSLSIGETFLYRGIREGEYTFAGEGGSRTVSARTTLAVEDVDRPGVYELSLGERKLCDVAYSFSDPAESDLRDLLPGQRPGQVSLAGVLADFTWMEVLLVFLALGLVALDWLVLSRRVPRTLAADLTE